MEERQRPARKGESVWDGRTPRAPWEWALQEKLLHNLEGLQREIDLLAEVLRGLKR